MFCDQCGATLEPGANFCTRCGKRLVPFPQSEPLVPQPMPAQAIPPPPYVPAAPPVPVTPTGRVGHHLRLIAMFWLLFAVIRLVGVFWLFAVGRIAMPGFIDAIVSLSQPIGQNLLFGRFVSDSLFFIAIWIGFWAALEIVAVWGLLAHAPWARILIIVLSILSLFRFPVGTVLAMYTLWVFVPAHAAVEYEQLAHGT